ncbi:hypothetical protein EDC96DRAFT_574096 [Choanephora cucurbitarum]|nr:hypothetical protein EDC96DRAFT_574096 [Choanephora cucurbitarum]
MFKLRPSTTQSSLSSIQSNENLDELTIESMSAVIAAAVQISSQGGQPSSLSLGSASILQPFSQKNQRSSFWPTRKSKPANIKDDGRDELVYRGIQIKESSDA